MKSPDPRRGLARGRPQYGIPTAGSLVALGAEMIIMLEIHQIIVQYPAFSLLSSSA